MKQATEKVWTDDTGEVLLREKADGRFYVPIAGASRKRLAELGEAIADALKAEPVEATR